MRIAEFKTRRLLIQDWTPALEDDAARAGLQQALARILTPPVLKHLPPPLQFDAEHDDIADWIDDRAAESDSLLVFAEGVLIGLVLMAVNDTEPIAEIHIGYLLAESAWGRGIATELLRGLVKSFKGLEPAVLLGGVGRDNPASARVLRKAGFERDPGRSTPDTDIFKREIG